MLFWAPFSVVAMARLDKDLRAAEPDAAAARRGWASARSRGSSPVVLIGTVAGLFPRGGAGRDGAGRGTSSDRLGGHLQARFARASRRRSAGPAGRALGPGQRRSEEEGAYVPTSSRSLRGSRTLQGRRSPREPLRSPSRARRRGLRERAPRRRLVARRARGAGHPGGAGGLSARRGPSRRRGHLLDLGARRARLRARQPRDGGPGAVRDAGGARAHDLGGPSVLGIALVSTTANYLISAGGVTGFPAPPRRTCCTSATCRSRPRC